MAKVKSDIEIAREADMKPIKEIAAKIGIKESDLIPYGHTKAKVSCRLHQIDPVQRGWQPDPGDGDQPDACR
jgi:formyltetrahydrofolate synthetase